LELIVTEHASERLADEVRFPAPPSLPFNEEVRLLKFQHIDAKHLVWMCQIDEGFLVGDMRHTRRRQMLVAMTALSRDMVRNSRYVRLACHRVFVDKITFQRSRKA
jgi:hypothetical protein